MNDPLVARPHLDGDDVAILGHLRRQHEDAEEVVAGRPQRHLLRHGQHQVGLAPLPALGESPRRRCVARVALRPAGVGPGGQRGEVPVRQTPVVVELHSRDRLPRRHPAALRELLDVLRPAQRLPVSQEREGGRLAGTVALLAVSLEDGQHVAVEGDGTANCRGGGGRDGAADGARGRRAHRAAGENVVQGLAQVRAFGPRVAAQACRPGVVDAAAVAEDEAGVEDEDLRDDAGREGGRGCAPSVFEDGDGDLPVAGLALDLGRIALVAVDSEEDHAALAVAASQVPKCGGVTAGNRTLEGQEDDDGGLAACEGAQRDRLAPGVRKGNVSDRLIQLGARRGVLRGRA